MLCRQSIQIISESASGFPTCATKTELEYIKMLIFQHMLVSNAEHSSSFCDVSRNKFFFRRVWQLVLPRIANPRKANFVEGNGGLISSSFLIEVVILTLN